MREALRKKPNLLRAGRLLQRAIAAGDPRAAYALGTWYLHGRGEHYARNLKKAVPLLRAAGKMLVPAALYDLAVCYERGVGVAKNDRMAAELYLRAALAGDAQAVYEVGRCYYYGIGMPKDQRVASVWLGHAKRLGVD